MDHNAFLVWWLLAVPIVLAIVDRITMGGSGSSGVGVADAYIARMDGRAGTATMAPGNRAL